MIKTIPLYLLGGLLLLLCVACANPAADAPAAEVSEPAAAPETDEPAAATAYDLSEDSTIGFVGAKITRTHEGGFKSFEGTVSVAGDSPESASIEVTIDTTSLWADDEKLTGHLKSADFFDVETYPTASFQSTGIAANEDGTYTITGNFDLHGVTKQISFPASIEMTEGGFSANAEFSIKRFDFGIVYPGHADDLIHEDVLIKLDLRSALDGGEMADMDEGGEMDEGDDTGEQAED